MRLWNNKSPSKRGAREGAPRAHGGGRKECVKQADGRGDGRRQGERRIEGGQEVEGVEAGRWRKEQRGRMGGRKGLQHSPSTGALFFGGGA